jgi:hypothetical protein
MSGRNYKKTKHKKSKFRPIVPPNINKRGQRLPLTSPINFNSTNSSPATITSSPQPPLLTLNSFRRNNKRTYDDDFFYVKYLLKAPPKNNKVWNNPVAADAKAAINFLLAKLAKHHITVKNYNIFALDGAFAASSRTFHHICGIPYKNIYVPNGDISVVNSIKSQCNGINTFKGISHNMKAPLKGCHLIYYDGTDSVLHCIPPELYETHWDHIYKTAEQGKGALWIFIQTILKLLPSDKKPVIMGVTCSFRNNVTSKWVNLLTKIYKKRYDKHKLGLILKADRKNKIDKWQRHTGARTEELVALLKAIIKMRRKLSCSFDKIDVVVDQSIFYQHDRETGGTKSSPMLFCSLIINSNQRKFNDWYANKIGLAQEQMQYLRCTYRSGYQSTELAGTIVMPQSRCYNFVVLDHNYHISGEKIDDERFIRNKLNDNSLIESLEAGDKNGLVEPSPGPKRHQIVIMRPNDCHDYYYMACVYEKYCNVKEYNNQDVYIIMWYMPKVYSDSLWEWSKATYALHPADFIIDNEENSNFIGDGERNTNLKHDCIWISNTVSCYTTSEMKTLLGAGWHWKNEWPKLTKGWYWDSSLFQKKKSKRKKTITAGRVSPITVGSLETIMEELTLKF